MKLVTLIFLYLYSFQCFSVEGNNGGGPLITHQMERQFDSILNLAGIDAYLVKDGKAYVPIDYSDMFRRSEVSDFGGFYIRERALRDVNTDTGVHSMYDDYLRSLGIERGSNDANVYIDGAHIGSEILDVQTIDGRVFDFTGFND